MQGMAVRRLVLQIIVLLPCLIKVSSVRNDSCPIACTSAVELGEYDIALAYPFGIGEGCYFDKRFEVICHNQKPFLNSSKTEINRLDYFPGASKGELTLGVNISLTRNRNKTSTGKEFDLSDEPFPVSNYNNWVTVIGCDNYDMINLITKEVVNTDNCFSMRSCEANQNAGCYDFVCPIPLDRKFDGGNISAPNGCKSAFVIERDFFEGTNGLIRPSEVLKEADNIPVRLQWGKKMGVCVEPYSSHKTIVCHKGRVGGYCSMKLSEELVCLCADGRFSKKGCSGDLICIPSSKNDCSKCPHGYRLSGQNNDQFCKPQNYEEKYDKLFKTSQVTLFVIIGCIGGVGTLLQIIGVWALYKILKIRKEATRLKEKFFKRNGGLLLKQRL